MPVNEVDDLAIEQEVIVTGGLHRVDASEAEGLGGRPADDRIALRHDGHMRHRAACLGAELQAP